ncbi:hypothetical protein BGZ65_006191 [Modicella reniformis]|uniref:CCD97-like C-terminal domain-containing protein n=1 Tax=Modicella reniformis TaxID=1440133 RepID=A0A9P6IWK0_9FUNG|nr:hypothetical protein BGZ65_006191 [Modicella reniformis]
MTTLTAPSINQILDYLDPHLETLQTGFPTSTRPNEPPLTKDQRQKKIKEALTNDPGIFLTKWGSVILYPRPTSSSTFTADSHVVNGGDDDPSSVSKDGLTAKDILDLFTPLVGTKLFLTALTTDYEVKYQLTKLYQQVQRLKEHDRFDTAQTHPSSATALPTDMELEPISQDPSLHHNNSNSGNSDNCSNINVNHKDTIAPEDRKPDPGQNDLFTRSIVSEKTRRNRRLNYLLRHLAPPDPSEVSSVSTSGPGKRGPGIRTTSHSSVSSLRNNYGSSKSGHGNSGSINTSTSKNTNHNNDNNINLGGGTLSSQHHPTLANIMSISGSLSNLSFSDSTYFSDAEMQARAPELYQQYIGRFMDNDDDDDEDDDDDDEDEDEDEDDDDDEEGTDSDGDSDHQAKRRGDPRRQRQTLKPFDKDVGLVDRVLWSIDHFNLKQQQQKLSQVPNGSSGNSISASSQYQSHHQTNHGQASSFVSGSIKTMNSFQATNEQEDESEFEEEFDTDSEDDEDSKLTRHEESFKDVTNSNGKVLIKSTITITPPVPLDPILGSTATTATASGAVMMLEEPEERTLFAAVEHVDRSESDSDKELDQATVNRKEDQEALRQEFVLLMKQRFLDGLDRYFDYFIVDFDETLDDLEQENHDEEDRWFDDEDEDEDNDTETHATSRGENNELRNITHGVAQTIRPRSGLSSRMALDERLSAWESSAQNGSGDYGY